MCFVMPRRTTFSESKEQNSRDFHFFIKLFCSQSLTKRQFSQFSLLTLGTIHLFPKPKDN